jgi:hypothetical protein
MRRKGTQRVVNCCTLTTTDCTCTLVHPPHTLSVPYLYSTQQARQIAVRIRPRDNVNQAVLKQVLFQALGHAAQKAHHRGTRSSPPAVMETDNQMH